MKEFNYTEWMQQNKVGPYRKMNLKESGNGDEPFDFKKAAIESASGDQISHTEEDKNGRSMYRSARNPNITYYTNNEEQIIKHDSMTGERYSIGDLRHYDEPTHDYEPDTDADYEEPSDDFDMAEGNEEDDARDARADKMEDDDTEAENSERDLNEDGGDGEVDKVIQKYESVLLKALAMRSENPEDIDAHDAVKKVLETIASTLGLDATIPFMEIEYFSGQYSPKEALEYAKEMFHDYKSEQGPIDEKDNIKSITIDIPENADYRELAKAVAKVLIEDYGQHNYKPFLQALIAKLK